METEEGRDARNVRAVAKSMSGSPAGQAIVAVFSLVVHLPLDSGANRVAAPKALMSPEV
jgi:hypothetical protein